MRSPAARSIAPIHVAERNAASMPGRRGRAGGRRALAFPLCNPVCPVAGNGFIVAAAACCGQTIGGRFHVLVRSVAASVAFAALVEPIPPRSGARG
jgi:hypothetical protein